jgi:two-component system, NarL family, response regulator NreC
MVAKIKVLIVDDHAVLRAGLRLLINAHHGLEVVGDAPDGVAGVQEALATNPDVVLLDINMPESNGFEALERLCRECPHARVLVLTMYDDPAYARSALAAGARGYLVKRSTDFDLAGAIQAVHRGETFVDASLPEDILRDRVGGGGTLHRKDAPGRVLTPREHQVLCLTAEGHSNKDIAERLRLSVKSVETYRARLSAKLGFQSRVDLMRYALEVGLLSRKPSTAG